jgi:hypothetical protein
MVFKKPQKLFYFSLILLVASSVVLAGCTDVSRNSDSSNSSLAPLEGMPDEVRSAPLVVQEAYQFAAANPEVLKGLPCYCGCGDMGHKNNYDCYVQEVSSDGTISFDSHALGCSICVDITQDAIRLLDQGKSLPEIRAYVDETYSRFGPSNFQENE